MMSTGGSGRRGRRPEKLDEPINLGLLVRRDLNEFDGTAAPARALRIASTDLRPHRERRPRAGQPDPDLPRLPGLKQLLRLKRQPPGAEVDDRHRTPCFRQRTVAPAGDLKGAPDPIETPLLLLHGIPIDGPDGLQKDAFKKPT